MAAKKSSTKTPTKKTSTKASTQKPTKSTPVASSTGYSQGSGTDFKPAQNVQANAPTRRSSQDIANETGIVYDQGAIENILNQGVDTKYAVLKQEQANNENKYYDNLAQNQQSLQDTLRQQQGSAMMSGVSRGAQAANQLSAMLGISQQGVAGATQLSQDRGALAGKEAADRAQVKSDAFDKSSANAATVAGLGEKYYSDDTTRYAADQEYNAATNQANAGYYAQKYASDTGLVGTKYSADQSAAAQVKAANIGAGATKYSADKNVIASSNYGVNAARASRTSSSSASTKTKTKTTSKGSG